MLGQLFRQLQLRLLPVVLDADRDVFQRLALHQQADGDVVGSVEALAGLLRNLAG
ncbi:hypothetical protein D3C78_1984650 [compost metagenome]